MLCLSASMKMRSKGPAPFAYQLLNAGAGVAQTDFDRRGESGASNVGPCDLRVFGIGFEADQPAAGAERASQPDAAVAAQCANFQNLRCSGKPRQEHEELALAGGNADRW